MGKRELSRKRSREHEDEHARGDGGRAVQLEELIRQEVNLLLQNEIRDPRLHGVAITMVQLARDGSCARLWFTTGDDDDKTRALEGAAGFLRLALAEGLALKRTPDLRFRRDPATRAFAGPPQHEENE
jgi:ribosome-binding factor A